MLYVEVVVGLPIDGVFDYSVKDRWEGKLAIGKRVLVPFRNQRKVGYIVNIKNYSPIKNIKPIYEVIDEVPILDNELLRLSKRISEYYYCFWGEAIELILPNALRKAKRIEIKPIDLQKPTSKKSKILLIQNLEGDKIWEIYRERIEEKLKNSQDIIFLVPQIEKIDEVVKKIKENFNIEPVVFHSGQKEKINLLSWQRVKNGETKIAVGTRMAVFLPFRNLGLIIIDEENNPSYKEERSPYYHTRVVAMMRRDLENTDIVMADISPSLEMLYLAKKKKVDYLLLEKKDNISITVIDTKREFYFRKKRTGFLLSYPLSELLNQALMNKEKVLIFLNRRGFSTYIYCPHCKKILKCPRCDINLTYHFKEKILLCHLCNYKVKPTKFCPECNSSYIRYSGLGVEKLESKLSLFYPQAKILRYDKEKTLTGDNFDFIIATEAIFKEKINVDLIAVVSLDNVLNRVDFRAGESAFYILLKLLSFNPKRMLIQTNIAGHYCFEALKKRDLRFFYERELDLRKELRLPPIRHLGLIELRGENQTKVKNKTESLFKKLKKINDKDVEVVSYFAHSPLKLRDNYIWQVMLKTKSLQKLIPFLKRVLKKFSASNIKISVDID